MLERVRTTSPELVVLVDDDGVAVGTQEKATVHHEDTPLHLAFSSYVVDAEGRVLVTRRAWEKITWPGVWTNSCCGHPAPGEPLDRAVLRRLAHELGIDADAADPVLPRFRYRAVMDNGVVEHEICPVFLVRYDAAVVDPRPDEVAEHRWQTWTEIVDDVASGTSELSPWCQDQVRQLQQLGPDPRSWPVSDAALLPPAARPL
ncbi:isopentenyl-diphosphate Delta-isomerase [Rhodococcus kroppenstedtii]|uniref:isopentenyl-diphosphate Delta-isomerase n=1 Tax=Rhodococcoides kroppenstedtii TaxID=293050 RepID=UPI002952FC7D|nr:isopentenyl-diphosphate Delta-isomerase [Rhodococcus kroppenstedtii]MDV7196687.1 isopentenyl-diphosphate Delta-isomerase [Rhodococcus kroppenstedtii]